jgi:hypothetical protein
MKRNLSTRLRRLEQARPVVPEEPDREEEAQRRAEARAKLLAHPDGPALLAEMAVIRARHATDCPSEQVLWQRCLRDPRHADLAASLVYIQCDPGARLSSLDGSS